MGEDHKILMVLMQQNVVVQYYAHSHREEGSGDSTYSYLFRKNFNIVKFNCIHNIRNVIIVITY